MKFFSHNKRYWDIFDDFLPIFLKRKGQELYFLKPWVGSGSG